MKNNHVEKTIHPCQFPVELVERLVLSMTNQGDRVFDPYMGVGSSVVAALKNGRQGYGCDVVQEYVDIAWERIHQLRSGTLQTRPMDKPVYDPKKKNGGHWMRIVEHYSHLNGLEYLMVHKPALWDEIQQVIANVDATQFKTKISKEKTMAGKILYTPIEMNKAMDA